MDNVLPWTMLHVSMGIPFLAASCNSVQHMNDRIVCGKSAPLVVPCVCLTHAGNGGFYYRSRTVTTHTPASVSRGRSTVTFMSFLLDSSSGRCVEGGGGGGLNCTWRRSTVIFIIQGKTPTHPVQAHKRQEVIWNMRSSQQ